MIDPMVDPQNTGLLQLSPRFFDNNAEIVFRGVIANGIFQPGSAGVRVLCIDRVHRTVVLSRCHASRIFGHLRRYSYIVLTWYCSHAGLTSAQRESAICANSPPCQIRRCYVAPRNSMEPPFSGEPSGKTTLPVTGTVDGPRLQPVNKTSIVATPSCNSLAPRAARHILRAF